MLTLFIAVEAKHNKDIVSFDSTSQIAGYYQTFGVTASNEEELKEQITEYLYSDTGGTLVQIKKRWIPDFSGKDKRLREYVKDINTKGIWYKSGKAWFSLDSD
jgi:hypothetical protein